VTAFQALLLGVIQGLTEFLPVSSSGHLALAEQFLGLSIPQQDLLGFDVLLHAATALALLLVYWRRWWAMVLAPLRSDGPNCRLLLSVIVATVPAAIAGFLFERVIAEQFRSIESVAVALLGTAIVLLLSHFGRSTVTLERIGVLRPLVIGCAQALALIPGLSRSGLTIASGQLVGVRRSDALDFSFLMAFPAIVGASVLISVEVWRGEMILPQPETAFTGFVTSLLASVLAILFLRRFVARHTLAWFAAYLIPVGVTLLLMQ